MARPTFKARTFRLSVRMTATELTYSEINNRI